MAAFSKHNLKPNCFVTMFSFPLQKGSKDSVSFPQKGTELIRYYRKQQCSCDVASVTSMRDPRGHVFGQAWQVSESNLCFYADK